MPFRARRQRHGPCAATPLLLDHTRLPAPETPPPLCDTLALTLRLRARRQRHAHGTRVGVRDAAEDLHETPLLVVSHIVTEVSRIVTEVSRIVGVRDAAEDLYETPLLVVSHIVTEVSHIVTEESHIVTEVSRIEPHRAPAWARALRRLQRDGGAPPAHV